MAGGRDPSPPPPPPPPPTRRSLCCFSLAAYSKALVSHLRSTSHVPIGRGLSDSELSSLESSLPTLSFPPDLRSLLLEGLPLSPHFPDWRSSPLPHLRLLLSLPSSSVLLAVRRRSLWCPSWGPRPRSDDLAVAAARAVLARAPPLVPLCGDHYVPARPDLPGNPVFLVRGGEVRRVAADIGEFLAGGHVATGAWAGMGRRRVEVWSELEEWVEVGRRLRDGGWGERDIREMMGMDGGDDGVTGMDGGDGRVGVTWRVKRLGMAMVRAGWSREEVGEAMGVTWQQVEEGGGGTLENDVTLDL